MLNFGRAAEASQTLAAFNRSLAVIDFSPAGDILAANANFLKIVGYEWAELKGRHHRIFVDPIYRESQEYIQFWTSLRSGEFKIAEYKRFGKGGAEVWLQATYNPVLDSGGKVFKIVKLAADITEQKLKNSEFFGQVAAISKSQAVIHFTLDGIITYANEHFLAAMGYGFEDIQGRHHSMFVTPAEKESAEYRHFWKTLNQGQHHTAEYKRLGKGGKEIWIQATYTPILDDTGKPFKVVKFAIDITDMVRKRMRRADIQSQIADDLQKMSSDVAQTSLQAASASAVTEQTAANVQSVAAAAEELGASVGEISRQVRQSAELAKSAVDEGARTNAIVKSLAGAAEKIETVVELINSIAGQTNLLALNATIEAARAGEAGRGFSVVATEVKSLAGQTSKATSEIASQISSVQTATREAVEALNTITGYVSELNTISSIIAAAVEEQAAVTQDVTQNMQVAAQGSEAVKQNMQAIAASADACAKQVGVSVERVQAASLELA